MSEHHGMRWGPKPEHAEVHARVLKLAREGWKNTDIARETGAPIATVKAWTKAAGMEAGRVPP